jgi:hypothetical protein
LNKPAWSNDALDVAALLPAWFIVSFDLDRATPGPAVCHWFGSSPDELACETSDVALLQGSWCFSPI